MSHNFRKGVGNEGVGREFEIRLPEGEVQREQTFINFKRRATDGFVSIKNSFDLVCRIYKEDEERKKEIWVIKGY